ncbi:DNA polymerase IV [Dongshaea marina]|uniref:DNA polymerase IV n=1 Tax=Dongshaea marina TaxID=2047966 RepID=UPI000D3E08E5|nr:DNA polymerase IV [Dongshaea marina]
MSSVRKIALLDMDAFFAAAEQLRHPELKNRPFAIGGSPQKRGVIATANYLARRFGVKSAISSARALQLCPQLTLIPGDYSYYKQLSGQVADIIHRYCDKVEQASIDEFYLDLTDSPHFQGSASLIMEAIRSEIRELGITASAGISSIKMVAKIASDDNKPDGQKVVPPEELFSYLAKLPLKRIPGVGPSSLAKLQGGGFYLGADIQQAELGDLTSLLGERHGQSLFNRCQGIDPREVVTERVRKSKGVENTLAEDIDQLSQAEAIISDELYPELLRRLGEPVASQFKIHSQTVKLKFNDFSQTTASHSCNRLSAVLFIQLLRDAWQRSAGRSVRLIGISVALADEGEQRQLELDL